MKGESRADTNQEENLFPGVPHDGTEQGPDT